jgi:DNA-binding transcriptional ArsR family regulator
MDLCSVKCINEKKVKETFEGLQSTDEIGAMADTFKALGDPSRLKIVLALLHQEHCVCDLAAVCGQSESAVSHQLRLLRTQKIVKNRREGKIIYYSLDDDHVRSLITTSLEHIQHD